MPRSFRSGSENPQFIYCLRAIKKGSQRATHSLKSKRNVIASVENPYSFGQNFIPNPAFVCIPDPVVKADFLG
jgi:hypothetical protein